MGSFGQLQPVEPSPNVIGFQNTIGGYRPAAQAMCSRVRQEHCIAVTQKHLRRSQHACAIVALAVQQYDRISVSILRANAPGP